MLVKKNKHNHPQPIARTTIKNMCANEYPKIRGQCSPPSFLSEKAKGRNS